MRKKSMFFYLSCAAVLAIVLRILMPTLGQSVAGGVQQSDAGMTLSACPGSPNCYQDVIALRDLKDSADNKQANIINELAQLINSQPGMEVVVVHDHYLHATATTRLFGFRDDVEFLWHPENLEFSVRSASRLGKSDLGANERRVARLSRLMVERF